MSTRRAKTSASPLSQN